VPDFGGRSAPVSVGRALLWVASLGGLALLGRSVFVAPVPLWVSVAALVGYVALATVGVFFPSLEMYGDVLSRGVSEARLLALTFDDGPDPETTPRVLETLAARGARATFFVIGEKAERCPEIVEAIVRSGHTLGVHGYRHDRLYAFKGPGAVASDVRRACDVVQRITGERPRWFRPPIGLVSPRTAVGARRAGVELVGWTVRGFDGVSRRDSGRVLRRVARHLEPGAIVMLHDAAERADHVPASLEILPQILDAAAERGLALVTLDELVAEEDVPART
jgi:peptidoglycan-N-acetylglucosamine deacetylase